MLAFIRDDAHITQDKVEQDSSKRKNLAALKGVLRSKHMVQPWTDAHDLTTRVVESLRNHISDDEDGHSPRPGWYRGDSLGYSGNVADELARLSAENDTLRRRLDEINASRAPQLDLVDIGNLKITEFKAQRSLYTFNSFGRANSPSSIASVMIGTVPTEEYEKFLDDVNRSFEVKLRIVNSGNKAAKDVVVDFEFMPCTEAALMEPELPQSAIMATVSIPPRWKTDPAEHAYIDQRRRDGDSAFVRQRIRSVSPGIGEDLVPFVVHSKHLNGEGWTMVCKYSVTDSEGSTLKGSFSIAVEFDRTKTMTETEIKTAFRATKS
ncbi:hypothetical protein [Polyangium sp. y55x31]|uniref:hypothetical protein n=1 Tax=Polyangium sp. y55x31 TaxID=3042688 RepID=UPI002482F78C|nr:hypothetical protein [Polyangium sp. y55x31]MDI1483342.1 hypothetical protein [Polyangium sp. y55x31]